MDRPGHDENTSFFVGTEVEHTPAYGQRTLFVVGLQEPQTIIDMAANNGCHYVYFGANQSFPKLDVNDADAWRHWEEMILGVLKDGLWCTLDIDSTCVEGLCESGLCEHNRFSPMISVKIPYAGLLNYNTVIKIDDKDFAATNPGVWCHSLHDLQDREAFTDWSKYTQDEVV